MLCCGVVLNCPLCATCMCVCARVCVGGSWLRVDGGLLHYCSAWNLAAAIAVV